MAKFSASPKKKVSGSTPKRKSNKSKPSDGDIHMMIERAAYFRAEQRNFAPGFEKVDWYEAEQEIIKQLGR